MFSYVPDRVFERLWLLAVAVKRAIGSHNPLNILLGINYSAFNGEIIGLVLEYQGIATGRELERRIFAVPSAAMIGMGTRRFG